MSWLVSLDCGKERDPSALGAIECVQKIHDPNLDEKGQERLKRYLKRRPVKIINHHVVRGLKRFPLGTSYNDVADDVVNTINNPEIMGEVTVLVDAGGVGLAVMDMLVARGVSPIGIMLKGTGETTLKENIYHVSKEEVVTALVVAFQTRRIEIIQAISNRDATKQLLVELEHFQMKRRPNGSVGFEADREETHDDLAMMLAQAIWFGDKTQFQTVAEGPLEEPVREDEKEYDPLDWGLL